MVRMLGSPNVFVNMIPWSRQGDVNTPHIQPGSPCPPCCSPIKKGSATVFINKKPAGRVGDPTCTMVAAGSPNVFCG